MRSSWKVPYINKRFFGLDYLKKNGLSIKERGSSIPSNYFGKSMKIYNGVWYSSLLVGSKVQNYKLGEFSYSRRVGTQKHLKEKRRKKSATTKKNK